MLAPPKVQPRVLADYLEVLIRAVFQSGPNWRVIDVSWDGFREELAADRGIVRNRRRIEATVDNAQAMLELDANHEEFQRWHGHHRYFFRLHALGDELERALDGHVER
jgi:3-methyladenine DNA glycosylase Tag